MRLTKNSQLYTIDNLHQLPESLKVEKLAIREEKDHIFLNSEATPFCNFHISHFTIERQSLGCGEQYIQNSKANLFND